VVEVKLLVTGATGLVGREVVLEAVASGHVVYASWHERKPEAGTPVRMDMADAASVREAFETSPDAVIHLAALTDVDRCESYAAAAYELNCVAAERVAREASARGAHMVYISTDYVFDGAKGLYTEADQPRPVNRYGWSKLKGEGAVAECSPPGTWCIVRTSTPYGVHPFRKSFAVFLAEKLVVGEQVSVVFDQFTSPTFTADLSRSLVEVTERRATGVLNVSGATRCSRLDFANALAEKLSADPSLIKPVSMREMRWKAVRPRDSSLSVERATALLKAGPKPLLDSLGRFVESYTGRRAGPAAFERKG
jgi:dTDP-4-dehydrorhamnose reductase